MTSANRNDHDTDEPSGQGFAMSAGGGKHTIRGTLNTEDRLREAWSRWASGVTVVALWDGEEVQAMTVSAFVPVSLEPPLLLVSLHEQATLLPSLGEIGRFTVNLLVEDQRRLASIFAKSWPVDASIFPEGGDPVLAGSAASLVCDVERIDPGGDHRLVIGRVRRIELGNEDAPLLYYDRGYRGIRE